MLMFSSEETNIYYNVYCTVLYLILLFISKQKINRFCLIQKHKSNFFILPLLFVFALTYCVGTDFYAYMGVVKNYDFTPGAYNYGEKIYGYLIYILDKNYFLFRVVVWGSALLLFKKASKLLKINAQCSLAILSILFILIFSYARASLGMAVFIYGVARFLKSRNLFCKTFSFVIVCCSCFFHSSMLALIILFVVSIFVPLNKKVLVIYGLLAIVFALTINQFMDYLITGSFIGADEIINKKLVGYSEKESIGVNFFGIIQNILSYGTFYIPFIIITFKLYKKNLLKKISVNIIFLAKLMLLIMILTTSLLFLNISSSVFFYRFLYMSMLPMTLIISYLIEHNLFSRREKRWIFCYGAVANLYVLFHSIYVTI